MIVTVSCPATMLDDANALAATLASGVTDFATFQGLNWQDSSGNLYAAASFEASPMLTAAAQAVLSRPAWDSTRQVNIAGAGRAQAAVVLWSGHRGVPAVVPSALTVVEGLPGIDALAAMGLVAVQGAVV